ncbi:AAA domain protein [uncultured archaeon]|nr:AAA domain protein [uncultured archaeon]
MEDLELLNEMVSQNPWWSGGKPLKEKTTTRDIWSKVLKEIDRKEVICFVGLRRVGKTVLMKQVIQNLLEKGIAPERILYFSFDAMKKEEAIIRRIVTLYSRNIIQEVTSELSLPVYIFLDEVQKIKEWGEEVKSIYDKDWNIKFLVSGSSSMNILKGSGESLLGRIKIHKIYPFSFREFLRYNGMEIERVLIEYIKPPLQTEKLMLFFDRYMKTGGFPEIYSLEENQIKNTLKTWVDLAFYRDIVNIFEVKRSDVLEGLFYSFIKESGNTVNYAKLSNSLNTKFETIKTYIEYLNNSFLIEKSPFYSASRIKVSEKNFKIYVSDHAFFHLEETEEGLIAETLVFNHCKKRISGDVFYWQDKKKNEVDIVLKHNKTLLPIEVKFRSKVDKKELKGMLSLMEKCKSRNGIVVTKNSLETLDLNGNRITLVPAWLFLLAE